MNYQYHFSRKTSVFILFLSLFHFPVYAVENEPEEAIIQEQLITVASQHPTPLRAVSSSVSVLDMQQLESLGYISLANALATLPSTSLSNNGGAGKASSISVRGEAGFRTQVLIDGINIADPSAPQTVAPLEHTLSAGITRVEALRGPQGLSYGADAGGVIDISTVRADEPGLHGSAQLEAGSYATQNASAGVNFSNDILGFSLLGDQLETDGFNSYVFDTAGDDDGYENTTLHSRLGIRPTDTLTLEGVYRSVQGETQYDGCFNVSHDCSSDYDQQSQRAALTWSAFGEHNFAYNKNEIERVNYSDGDFSFGALGSLKKYSYKGTAEILDVHTLVFGLDENTERFTSFSQENGQIIVLSEQYEERKQKGAFAEYLGNFNHDVYLNLGLRHDDNDDFGTHNSYRVGAAKLFNIKQGNEIKLKASYGTGFRAPSIYEEYLNESFGPEDMPELHEETSAGYDIGVEYYGASGLHLEAVYFDQSVEDEIYYDLVGFSGYLQGEGKTESTGMELIASVPLNAQWSYSLNYTYTDSRESDDSRRSRVPRNSVNFSLSGRLLEERLHIALHLQSKSDMVDEISMSTMDDYIVLSANLSYAVLPNLEFYVRAENLSDKEYQSVPGYYAAEASVYGGMKLHF